MLSWVISLITLLALQSFIVDAQGNDGGYIGYSIRETGDKDSVVYETADTPSNASASTLPPDVYLNATVNVGEIDIEVQNLTAQINLAAQVLSLLNFNAGVDVSIDQVSLTIQNVSAKVLLEARLENLVRMIDDVLSSLDLNPALASLGSGIGQIANATGGALSGNGTGLSSRSLDYDLEHNILYSVNDYSGNTHTNRILAQNGDIVDQSLHNDGTVYQEQTVGNYKLNMTFNGYNQSVQGIPQATRELEYTYAPFPGLMAISAIYIDDVGRVAKTQVLSESRAGGSSTIGGELKT